MKPEQHERDRQTGWQLRFLGLGLELGGGIAGFLLLGWLIDRGLGTSPRWMLVGAIAGCVGGLYYFLSQAVRMARQQEREDRARRRQFDHDGSDDGRAV